ncbi:hypothetical protein ADL35_10925 [Streptomyces sp. NRRL WC-3753]|nr:hypothetical protein SMCF_5766 [Streptomyces coelicoflavus ZG0656]KPC86745.1 hypothetical protein ADL35_10925 [Streptomyces sp. NRRL WC-3753]
MFPTGYDRCRARKSSAPAKGGHPVVAAVTVVAVVTAIAAVTAITVVTAIAVVTAITVVTAIAVVTAITVVTVVAVVPRKRSGRGDMRACSFRRTVTPPEEVRPMNAVSTWVLPLPVMAGD